MANIELGPIIGHCEDCGKALHKNGRRVSSAETPVLAQALDGQHLHCQSCWIHGPSNGTLIPIGETPDINVTGIGESVLQFEGLTDAGRDWLRDNCASEPWQWLGNRLGVEHRVAGRLIEHAADDGLRVRVN